MSGRVEAPGAWVIVVVVGSFLVGLSLAEALRQPVSTIPAAVLMSLGLPAVVLGSIRFARSLR